MPFKTTSEKSIERSRHDADSAGHADETVIQPGQKGGDDQADGGDIEHLLCRYRSGNIAALPEMQPAWRARAFLWNARAGKRGELAGMLCY
jgi:hypothetical protein